LRKRTGSLWLITACLLGAARLGAAQTVTQVSTLTSTTTGEVLQLSASVVPVPGSNRFDWSYRLTNPANNTVRINSFTAAPRADLSSLAIVRSPVDWVPARVTSGEQKVVWNWLPNNPANPTNLATQLDPGETFLFEFELNQGAVPNAGEAAANNSHGFSAPSVGASAAPGGPPVGAVPEPATMSLVGIGLLPLAALLKRPRRLDS
jgi:PEP-CTERM motif